MARPIKNTVDYFPHIIKNGKTIFILENKYGNDGYAFWFKLLELLGSSHDQVYDFNNLSDWEFLIAKTKVSEEKATEILKTLADVEAIDRKLLEKKVIWCENFVEGIEDVYRKRKRNRPQKPVIDNGNPTTIVVSVAETPQSKVKYIKVNEIKENINNIYTHWNSKGITVHKNIEPFIQAIKIALKKYSEEDIKTAIGNYAHIVNGQEYYYDHKYTLNKFLDITAKTNHIEQFLDLEIAKNNYKKGGANGQFTGTHRPLKDSGEDKYKHLEETYEV